MDYTCLSIVLCSTLILCWAYELPDEVAMEMGDTHPSLLAVTNSTNITIPGCRSSAVYVNFMICDDPNMDKFPKIEPMQLDGFALKMTLVEKLEAGAFRGSAIRLIVFDENPITSIHADTFEGVIGLEHLIICHNKIATLDLNMFRGLHNLQRLVLRNNVVYKLLHPFRVTHRRERFLPALQKLDLSANPLYHISQDTFASFASSSIVELNLHSCQINNIEAGSFSQLKHLENVNLCRNPELGKTLLTDSVAAFANSTIKYLALGHNQIRGNRFPKAALSYLENSLERLQLFGNSINHICPNMWPYLPKLKALNLVSCGISCLSPSTFNALPELVKLNFSDNRMLMVPAEALTEKLEVLDMSSNPSVKDGHSMPPRGARNLGFCDEFVIEKHCVAGSNESRGGVSEDESHHSVIGKPYSSSKYKFQLNGWVWKKSPNLTVLMVNNVPLHEIDFKDLVFLDNLHHLELNNALLQEIKPGAFSDLASLRYLSMKGNKRLKLLGNSTFDGLRNLEALDISACNLQLSNNQSWSEFDSLSSLKALDLSSNNLSDISPVLFRKLENLRDLRLNHNLLQNWSTPMFPPNRQNLTRSLDVSHNQICHLTKDMVTDIKAMTIIDVSGNPFMCQCSVLVLNQIANKNETFLRNWNTTGAYMCKDREDNRGWNRRKEYSLIEWGKLHCEECHREVNSLISEPSSDESSSLMHIIMPVALAVCCIAVIVITAVLRKRYYVYYVFKKAKYQVRRHSVSEKDNFLYDAFVCYCEADRPWVSGMLVPILEGSDSYCPVRLCLHERDFTIGKAIADNVVESVEESRMIVLVLSSAFLQSHWCMFEMQLAQSRLLKDGRSSILLIVMEDIPKEFRTKSLSMMLATKTYLRWDKYKSEGNESLFWDRLRGAILDNKLLCKRESETNSFCSNKSTDNLICRNDGMHEIEAYM